MEKTNNKHYLWIAVAIVLAMIIAAAVYYIFHQDKRMKEYQLQSELVKEELADEYNDLSNQYEGFKMTISNDSLIAKMESERMKVQRLQEELRTIKSTNAKRINELMQELKTLRTILQGYIQQIDSLNRLNERLTAENRTVKAQYNQVTQTVSQLSQEKAKLAETVQMASKLDASNISVTGLNKKNKSTNKINNMDKIEVRFVINKNITAVPGEKTIYIRIQRPDDDVLVKSRSNVFMYENKEINYSAKRPIEYTGEEYPISIYWLIEETLMPGTYRVDIFADGNRIGQKSFKLEK
jgi:chromosome segregation ATPase